MDTFGRLISVLMAILLIFGLPLQHDARVLNSGSNKEIFHEMSIFIDQVCIRGELHKSDYIEFLDAIDDYCQSITIDIEIHTPTHSVVKENGSDGIVAFKEEIYMDVVYTDEIMDVLSSNEQYILMAGDMLTLRITLVKQPILNKLKNILFFLPKDESFVYGGIVL